ASPMTAPFSEKTQRILRTLADQTGQTETEILDKAVDAYYRKVFFEQLNDHYAALRANPEAWAEELAERKLCDATLMDGLDLDERWTEDGRCLTPGQEEK